jgi:hypothetical protein
MKLFYLRAEAHDGDADGPTNMDLFVHAADPATAVRLWGQHYAGWNDPDHKRVKVYDVSQTALAPCIMDWSAIPMTEYKAPKL